MSPHNNSYARAFIFRALFTWLLFIPIAFINGLVRERIYRPLVGELTAHQISCGVASIAFMALAYFMLRHFVSEIGKQTLWATGIVWVVLTISFEFGIGRFVTGNAWEKLLNDYNVLEGRLWDLVLITILITPVVIKKLATTRLHSRGRGRALQ